MVRTGEVGSGVMSCKSEWLEAGCDTQHGQERWGCEAANAVLQVSAQREVSYIELASLLAHLGQVS